MAKSRSIPTAWMTDPDYMELESDVQVILLMLILTADDEGRGQAHTGMLSRHFNKPAQCIEDALTTLASLELVACYVVGRHRYYQLLRWGDWQTLSKPTPSRFPAPPPQFIPSGALCPRESLENPGSSPGEGEGERKGKRREHTMEQRTEELPPGITRFPPLPSPSASFDGSCALTLAHQTAPQGVVSPSPAVPEACDAPIQQLARILHLPITDALTRLVAEYATLGSLALLGEADAAREWIDDPARNQRHTHMTVAFFRRWLKRGQDRLERRLAAQPALSGSAGPLVVRDRTSAPCFRSEGSHLPSLMHLVEEDRRAKGGWD
jgi:hypothetical protein